MQTGRGKARRSQRPSFARSAITTYGTNLSVALLSFVSVLITARALGAVGRGDIAFLTTIAFLTAQLSTFGVAQANANFARPRAGAEPLARRHLARARAAFGGTGRAGPRRRDGRLPGA